MPPFRDLRGMRFGSLTVVARCNRQGERTKWLCHCDCGNETEVFPHSLLSGATKSCGCSYKLALEGRRFGRLTVIRRNQNGGWDCVCDCGNMKNVATGALTHGYQLSCGCLHAESARKLLQSIATTHGKSNTRLFVVWNGMINRCDNPDKAKYPNYAGRGISVCEEWKGKAGFQHFWDWAYANGYDDSATKGQCTLDRIDVNGDYEPSNCRWVTNQQQQNNRRNNRYITHRGETKTVAEWSRIFDVPYQRFYDHVVCMGWEIDQTVNFLKGEKNAR